MQNSSNSNNIIQNMNVNNSNQFPSKQTQEISKTNSSMALIFLYHEDRIERQSNSKDQVYIASNRYYIYKEQRAHGRNHIYYIIVKLESQRKNIIFFRLKVPEYRSQKIDQEGNQYK
ncbi:hypothetical protein ABPG72_002328 [Tetrahymena utriculariae]